MRYHIKLSKEMIAGAKYAILPGDPGRVEKTAKYIDTNYKLLASNREYTSALTELNGEKVLVCSTGIGGPSTSIALEELASLGIKYFYRIGTTGAIQKNIDIPSIIITTASVRLDGASLHYAPIQYPAVADFELTTSLVQSAKKMKIPYYTGITASSDTFYPGQERYDTYSGYVIKDFQGSLKEWQKLNVLNYEMESASFLTILNTFGLHGAVVLSVIVNRTKNETPLDDTLKIAEENLAKVVKEAVFLHTKLNNL